MLEVGRGLGQVHRLDGEPGGDPLVQGGEHARPQLPVQGGLADQDRGERGRRIHVGVGQKPQFLELVGLQQVGLVADDHDAAAPFGGLGGEQVAGLGHQLGLEVTGPVAGRADDRHMRPAGAEGGIGDVDDLMAGGVQAGDRGAQRHCLARADVAG